MTKKLQTPTLNGPADHVAFVIHGIGQQTEKFGFFQQHLQSLYNTTNKAVQENIPEREINIAYIPIEWHKRLHEETDSMMDDITLRSIPTMRMVNSDYLSDAFFYLSKERGQSIVNHVTKTFNEEYMHFIRENPGFNGKIFILAYSLGGIIAWDILSNQQKSNRLHSKLDIVFPRLVFKPDYLFTLGSPLSAFLTIRSQDPKVYHPHSSIVFENIFHPFDPLAYRFEPLLKPSYKNKPAVLIDTSFLPPTSIWDTILSCITRQQEKIMSLVTRERQQSLHFGSTISSGNTILAALKRYFSTSVSFTPQNINNVISPSYYSESVASTPKLSLDCGSEQDDDEDEEVVIVKQNEEGNYLLGSKERFVYIPHTDMTTQKRRHYDDSLDISKRQKLMNQVLDTTITKGSNKQIQCLDLLPKRIDFVLQPEKLFGFLTKNEYVSGLTAHFSYWTHQDLMWHIVRRLENL